MQTSGPRRTPPLPHPRRPYGRRPHRGGTWSTSHEWVRWPSGVDTAVLLLNLCQHIDHPDVTREALVALVHQWRANALQALRADDWKASVDAY